ncbi:type VI secretion system protein TssA [Halomonas dongshanensis]|uniref:Type VI secretion system protein TssA n=1 Tax=Halomonas dongshanensis TaxID=2890835 RepID=A0ABT2EGX1_9GAMM|nr:type VI secretion system protein TssA [Halomonas dongshanensis]MCS2610810.1 type VI secretion system protein TssA [Halomonas dongshanensis]
MRITAETQLAPILAPLEPNDVGQPVEESADYLALDEEMMKVGSLQHGSVDWERAEGLAVTMLSERGKDLRVLAHLLHCLQQESNGVRFALSLHLLAQCLQAPWWESAYPFAGKRGAKMRPRLFHQLVQRAVKLAAGLDFDHAEEEFEACQAALDALQAQTERQQLPGEALGELAKQLIAKRPAMSAPGTPATSTTATSAPAPGAVAPAKEAASTAAPDKAALKAPEVRLEAGNERANRQVLLTMADFLAEQSPGEPLVYRLRRYAIWQAIQALPAARDSGKTELAPVSADRVADYRESLSKGADDALWQRIERSLALSPYWLEGHRLSATAARQLGHGRCAEAIREEALRFVERLAGIEALSFNNGTAFVDEETQRWLHSSDTASGAASPSGNDAWQAGLEEAREHLDNGDMASALSVMDQGLAAARSPRESTYWRLASADLLNEAGLSSLAQQHYRTLHETVTALALEHWEPALASRLGAALKESASA